MDLKPKPVKYLDGYPELPINAPTGSPHIIDLECLDHDFPDSQPITIADLVVTILFKFMPQTLTAFLDLERSSFHYILAGGSVSLDFCIKRVGRMVTVGFLNEKELGGWDIKHVYSIDGESTEQWTPVQIKVGAEYSETDAERVSEAAPGFAYSLFLHEVWHGEYEAEVVCGLSDGRSF